jgi:hypothetical protein
VPHAEPNGERWLTRFGKLKRRRILQAPNAKRAANINAQRTADQPASSTAESHPVKLPSAKRRHIRRRADAAAADWLIKPLAKDK